MFKYVSLVIVIYTFQKRLPQTCLPYFRYNWDTPVKSLVNEFRLIDQREANVTIRDLAAHKVGLIDYIQPMISATVRDSKEMLT